MKIIMNTMLLLLFALVFPAQVTASSPTRDGYIPTSETRDSKNISATNAPPVFIYSSGNENPLETCVPEVVTLKTPTGTDVVTRTVCEKIHVATNPNRLFEVSGACLVDNGNTATTNCAITNPSPAWQVVTTTLAPLIDNSSLPNWASLFCGYCTWDWLQTANTCQSVTKTQAGMVVSNNFSSNRTGSCSISGTFKVSDAETGLSWVSPPISAFLDATPPPCIPEATQERWLNDSSSCPANHSGSITWQYQQTKTSTCYHIKELPVYGGWVTTGAKRNQSNSCIEDAKCSDQLGGARTQWVASSSSCSSGTGTKTFEKEQKSTPSCSSPYAPVSWSSWSDTGSIRNVVDNCTGACDSAVPPKTQWVSTSTACATGVGARTFEKEQRSVASCPSQYGSVSWSAWSDTGNIRNDTNTCNSVVKCDDTIPANKRWVSATRACAAGYSGTISYEQEQSSQPYCPSQYGNVNWLAWTNTGATRNDIPHCVAAAQACPQKNFSIPVSGSKPAFLHTASAAAGPSGTFRATIKPDNPDGGRCKGVSYQVWFEAKCNDGTWDVQHSQASCNF